MFKFGDKKLLLLILIFSALIRLIRLDYPSGYVFDEVYHAFTAKQYVSNLKQAWDPWATPPSGVAFEWTHPPVAKEIMALSMIVFKTTNPWAYRLPGVVLGVFCVFVIYKIALKIFDNNKIALTAAYIFSLDGLNFVQSRTGMNDIYLVTFVLISLLFFIDKRYLTSAIFFGLAISSKWSGIYLLIVYLPYLIIHKQMKPILYFSFIPVLIYILSYIPYFLLGYSLGQFIELQKQMWIYHNNLKATHGYSSSWWSWPLNLYPVWYFVDYKDNLISNIFASGNPFIYWSGILAIILSILEVVTKRIRSLTLILLGVFAFWLPWILSPRIMFLYHFSPSVPFLSLALAYQLTKSTNGKINKILLAVILGLFLLGFLILYPFLTGFPLPKNFVSVFFSTNSTKNPF